MRMVAQAQMRSATPADVAVASTSGVTALYTSASITVCWYSPIRAMLAASFPGEEGNQAGDGTTGGRG